MTGTFKVDTSKVRSTAAALQTSGNQVKNLTAQMTLLVNGLSGSVWSGDAATAYTRKFSGLQTDINKMVAMINEHVTDLNQMAGDYEKAESANTAEVNGLVSTVII